MSDLTTHISGRLDLVDSTCGSYQGLKQRAAVISKALNEVIYYEVFVVRQLVHTATTSNVERPLRSDVEAPEFSPLGRTSSFQAASNSLTTSVDNWHNALTVNNQSSQHITNSRERKAWIHGQVTDT